MSQAELKTSGTPRSTFSSVYTASMAVRTEYSVVKTQSRWRDSANWPMKAKLAAAGGTTAGRSPACRGMKNEVT